MDPSHWKIRGIALVSRSLRHEQEEQELWRVQKPDRESELSLGTF